MSLPPITRQQSRQIDHRATDEYGIASLILMENAGRGVADVSGAAGHRRAGGRLLRQGEQRRRRLRRRPAPRPARPRGPGARLGRSVGTDGGRGGELRDPTQAGVPITFFDSRPRRTRRRAWRRNSPGPRGSSTPCWAPGPRASRGPRWTASSTNSNAAGIPILAVDLPSGLDCDTGQAALHTIRAAHTCTFIAPKLGFSAPTPPPTRANSTSSTSAPRGSSSTKCSAPRQTRARRVGQVRAVPP